MVMIELSCALTRKRIQTNEENEMELNSINMAERESLVFHSVNTSGKVT